MAHHYLSNFVVSLSLSNSPHLLFEYFLSFIPIDSFIMHQSFFTSAVLIFCSFYYVSSSSLNFCGETINAKLRVIGGRSAPYSNYSFYGVLFSSDSTGYSEMCGCTVLNDRWILTAAHCIPNGLTHASVRLGLSPLSTLSSFSITIPIRQTIIHNLFDYNSVHNDIALVQTAHRIPLGKSITTVCLPRNDEKIVKNGEKAIVAGFGIAIEQISDEIMEMGLAKTLQETTVSLISNDVCYRTWYSMTGGTNTVTKKQICAGDLGHGTAPGDSGGPLLVIDKEGNTVQIGITSYGANGVDGIIDQGKYPGVYTRVSSYIPWIESMISLNELSTNYSNQPITFVLFCYCIFYCLISLS